MKKPVVAIIGRPNVGKSTLFNRIIRRREAIVDAQPGVTRDRNYAEAEWAGIPFTLIDTGGYIPDSKDIIHQAVLNQAQQAMAESDLVVFLVDAKDGVTPMDEEIARILQKSGKKSLLVVNKVDTDTRESEVVDFYQLGLGEPISISAATGRKVGDFLDELIQRFPRAEVHPEEGDETTIKLAVVGKPNVGKSSFINALLGTDKLIVTDIPGTTRDSIDTLFTYQGQKYLLIDTAGLRKRSRIKEAVEYYSVVRSLNSIRRCHVAIVITDATEGLTDQDKNVIEEAIRARKGIILAVNKWDLIEKDAGTAKIYESKIQDELRGVNYLPILFISALTKKRIYKVIEIAKSVHQERNKRLKTSDLNKFLEEALSSYSPPDVGRKQVKIKYCTQVKAGPPVFAFFTNIPNAIKPNYKQFLENKLRECFGFFGVPLTLVFRKK
ncbi:MAG: ribosome biogenesis GTPase Der [candidate division KSB1 bacterium]|nr:ribosome biogenesis GTPase Der [candidate division KSB1 bacterium]